VLGLAQSRGDITDLELGPTVDGLVDQQPLKAFGQAHVVLGRGAARRGARGQRVALSETAPRPGGPPVPCRAGALDQVVAQGLVGAFPDGAQSHDRDRHQAGIDRDEGEPEPLLGARQVARIAMEGFDEGKQQRGRSAQGVYVVGDAPDHAPAGAGPREPRSAPGPGRRREPIGRRARSDRTGPGSPAMPSRRPDADHRESRRGAAFEQPSRGCSRRTRPSRSPREPAAGRAVARD
jgi:hypothetical protein